MREKATVYNPRDGGKYPPVILCNIEFGKAKAIVGIGRTRIVIKGNLCINSVSSIKWGKEVHLQIYAPKHYTEKRNPSSWSRVEIYFPFSELDKLIDTLLRLHLEAKKEGIEW